MHAVQWLAAALCAYMHTLHVHVGSKRLCPYQIVYAHTTVCPSSNNEALAYCQAAARHVPLHGHPCFQVAAAAVCLPDTYAAFIVTADKLTADVFGPAAAPGLES
jgi:hypothetical protein